MFSDSPKSATGTIGVGGSDAQTELSRLKDKSMSLKPVLNAPVN